jgi:outer membrane protein OmpA-like peptidoglycan-associated protein
VLRRAALGGLACAVVWPSAVHAVYASKYFVFLDFQSTEITPQGVLTMTKFLNAYRSRGDETRVAISGYTDTAEASEALAQARGEIVRDRLVALGLPANRYAELWFPNWR